MSRKRMISPEIWSDPSFNKLSREARLLFIGMVSNADDDGYIRGDAGSLKRIVFGFDSISISKTQRLIEEIKQIKNVHFYEVNGETYSHFVKWRKHQKQQKDRIQPSNYPPCSKCLAGDTPLHTKAKLSKELASSEEIRKTETPNSSPLPETVLHSSLLETVFEKVAPGIFDELKINDPHFQGTVRTAYLTIGKAPTEKAVRSFILKQVEITPPEEYFDFAKQWPKGKTA